MWHIEFAACHIEERCMKETFIQRSKGVFVSDKYRQQVRLAVLVAQTRGTVCVHSDGAPLQGAPSPSCTYAFLTPT